MKFYDGHPSNRGWTFVFGLHFHDQMVKIIFLVILAIVINGDNGHPTHTFISPLEECTVEMG